MKRADNNLLAQVEYELECASLFAVVIAWLWAIFLAATIGASLAARG